MTALTTILAMSTMALGIGDGAEMTQPMAIVTMHIFQIILWISKTFHQLTHMIQSQDTGNFPGDFVYVLPAFLIIHNKLLLFP